MRILYCAGGESGIQIHHWVPEKNFSVKTSPRYRMCFCTQTPTYMESIKQMREANNTKKYRGQKEIGNGDNKVVQEVRKQQGAVFLCWQVKRAASRKHQVR